MPPVWTDFDARPLPAADYLRGARRLRARYAHDLPGLHHALRDWGTTARRESVAGRGGHWTEAGPGARAGDVPGRRAADLPGRRPGFSAEGWAGDLVGRTAGDAGRAGPAASTWPWIAHVPPAVVAAFVADVRGRLDGAVLRQSERAAVLRTARRRGLRRFDANLLIAAAQHAAGAGPVCPEIRRESPPGRGPTVVPWLVAGAAQAAVVACGWWMLG